MNNMKSSNKLRCVLAYVFHPAKARSYLNALAIICCLVGGYILKAMISDSTAFKILDRFMLQAMMLK